MTRFLIKRGKRARTGHARAHLGKFNARGEITGAWCGRIGFDLDSNVPWGLKVCKHCVAAIEREPATQRKAAA